MCEDPEFERADDLLNIGDFEFSNSGWSGYVQAWLYEDARNTNTFSRAYFSIKLMDIEDNEAWIPRWAARAKAIQLVYEWVSKDGEQSVSHLGKINYRADIQGHEFDVSFQDILKEEARAKKRENAG